MHFLQKGQKIRAWVDPPPLIRSMPEKNVFFLLMSSLRTTASQDIFVGFNPLTIISGQSYISELIAQHSHFSDDRSSQSSQKMKG